MNDDSSPTETLTGLRRALVVTLAGSAVVLWRMWSVGAPSLGSAEATRAHQRLTPVDAPRFRGGEWIDAEGQALGEGPR
jgi:hypothetical protein